MPLVGDHVHRSYLANAKNLPTWRAVNVRKYRRIVAEILDKSPTLEGKTDDELKALSASYHLEVINGRPLSELIVPTFALVREASRRVLRMAHYPVQLLGGICLHHGNFVEMATGEGKTLVSTCPAYLNALTDRGVHIVTVNDYLANRDAEEMGRVHQYLGLSVGVITTDKNPDERVREYRCSVTYGTNKEFGFDYLRDGIRARGESWYEFGKPLSSLKVQRVQRAEFHFAIIDEVDSVLIDDARTPLIIAEAPDADEEMACEFNFANSLASELIEDVDYSYDRADKRVEWLRDGEQRVTRVLGGKRSPGGHRIDWHDACLRALKAHIVFHRDVDYVIEKDEVMIVDESTGRKMPGRQWEEGLHQAVAVKEGLPLKGQTQTLARTTYQIFFNRYERISGMSGTILTDQRELGEIYAVGSIGVPTNRPCIRKNYADKIFATEDSKWRAVVRRVSLMIEQGRAVLIGTRSIDKSEHLSRMLTEAGIEHVVLNARQEEFEATIVSEAGKPGKVTVATNMAGRGTDIKLHPDVAAAGGLHVLGTERHESRRVDNQLAGRAARQGDPGSAEFFVSLEDPLLKRYRPKTSAYLVEHYRSLGDQPIQSALIRRFFRWVQRGIERQHRGIRNDLLKYDRERSKYNRMIGTE